MKIVVNLAPGLHSFYSHLPPKGTYHLEHPVTVETFIRELGINPLVVLAVVSDGRRLDFGEIIDRPLHLNLLSPLSGG